MAVEKQVNEKEILLKDIPLSALQEESLLTLYTLDHEMILFSDKDDHRDWRGILKYADVLDIYKKNLLENTSGGYMKQLLHRWIDTNESRNCKIGHLQNILIKIDRHDIYEDTLDNFEKDAELYRQKKTKAVIERTNTGSYIITSLDRQRAYNGLKLIVYDAFLMYSENDEDFAETIINNLLQHKMHVCTKNDFLGGIPFEHDAAMALIANRCRRVIIILSKTFLNCPADIFISKYAQHIGIEQSKRKLLPCLKEECIIPSNLRIVFNLKFFKSGKLFNFWEKLFEAMEYSPDDEYESEEYDYLPYTKNPAAISNEIKQVQAIEPPVQDERFSEIQSNTDVPTLENSSNDAAILKMIQTSPDTNNLQTLSSSTASTMEIKPKKKINIIKKFKNQFLAKNRKAKLALNPISG